MKPKKTKKELTRRMRRLEERLQAFIKEKTEWATLDKQTIFCYTININ